MAPLPRWDCMTDQSKAVVRRTAIGAGVLVIAAIVLRALLPWLVLALVAWLAWRVHRSLPDDVTVSEIDLTPLLDD